MAIGLIILFVCLSVFILYFGLFGNAKTALFGILILGFSLRLFMSLDGFLHDWDEKYHALVAKNLIENPLKPTLLKDPPKDYNYKNWWQNHVWLHKPPAALWLMAGSIKVFGLHALSVRIPSLLLSTLTIALIFMLSKRLFNSKVAVSAAYLFAINGFFLEQASGRIASDHIDTIFLFFSAAAFTLIVGRKNSWKRRETLLASVFFALALLTKSYIALLIPLISAISACADLKELNLKKAIIDLSVLVLPGLVVHFAYNFYMKSHFPLEYAYESHYNLLHFTKALEEHGEPWHYYFNALRVNYNELIYLPLAYLVYRCFKDRDRHLIVLCLWIAIPLAIFSFAETKMPGYLNIAAPAIFITIGWFVGQLFTFRLKSWAPKVFLVVLLGLACRYSFERIKPFESDEKRNPQWSLNIKEGKLDPHHKIEYLFYNEK